MEESGARTVCRYCGTEVNAAKTVCPACRRAFTETCSLCKGKFDKNAGVTYQKLYFCRNCLVNEKEKVIRKTSYELRRNIFYARFVVNRMRREVLAREERSAFDG